MEHHFECESWMRDWRERAHAAEAENERLRGENKRLRIALDLVESMTTAPMLRTNDEWREDIGGVLWAVRDIRNPGE